MLKKRFFRKIPRANVYLGLPTLAAVLLKILLKKLKAGEKTREWEKKFSRYFQTKEAIIIPRARIALFYLLKNLELPKGSEVILTPLTIADIVNAIRWAGLKPVFCDLSQNTYNIDYKKLEKSVNEKTKAVLVTHLAGFATDMDKILDIAKKNNLILIEDASQAFGARFKNKHLGAFGTAGIFSLSFLKTCSTLFGGMMILDNRELAEKIRGDIKGFPHPPKKLLMKETIKNIIVALAAARIIFSLFTYYFIKFFNKNTVGNFIRSNPKTELSDRPPQKFLHSYTDIQSEIGLKILENIEKSDEKRIKNIKYFIDNLSSESRRHLPIAANNARNVFWRLPIKVNGPEKFMRHLFRNYIDSAQTNLALCSEEAAFKDYFSETPNAWEAKHKSVFIPIHSGFNKRDMIYMAEVINNYFKKN